MKRKTIFILISSLILISSIYLLLLNINSFNNNLIIENGKIPHEVLTSYFPDSCSNRTFPTGRTIFKLDTSLSHIPVTFWLRNCKKCYKIRTVNVINDDSLDIRIERHLNRFKDISINICEGEGADLDKYPPTLGYEYNTLLTFYSDFYLKN